MLLYLCINICSETDRKERELRKRIQELSKGVHIGDREFEAAKLDLEKMTAKATKLEGKRLQVSKEDIILFGAAYLFFFLF